MFLLRWSFYDLSLNQIILKVQKLYITGASLVVQFHRCVLSTDNKTIVSMDGRRVQVIPSMWRVHKRALWPTRWAQLALSWNIRYSSEWHSWDESILIHSTVEVFDWTWTFDRLLTVCLFKIDVNEYCDLLSSFEANYLKTKLDNCEESRKNSLSNKSLLYALGSSV